MWGRTLRWADPLEEEMATSPVFLPGKSHGQSSLVGYSLQGLRRVRHNLATKRQNNIPDERLASKCILVSRSKMTNNPVKNGQRIGIDIISP